MRAAVAVAVTNELNWIAPFRDDRVKMNIVVPFGYREKFVNVLGIEHFARRHCLLPII